MKRAIRLKSRPRRRTRTKERLIVIKRTGKRFSVMAERKVDIKELTTEHKLKVEAEE